MGFSLEDIESWGGQVRYDRGLPNGVSTSGKNIELTRIDLAKRGDVDAIFDEAVNSWVGLALDAGMRILPLKESVVEKLESMGFRRSYIKKERWPKLPADVLALDFSGWPIYRQERIISPGRVRDRSLLSVCARILRRVPSISLSTLRRSDSGKNAVTWVDGLRRNQPEAWGEDERAMAAASHRKTLPTIQHKGSKR
jgi:hypothetical protein